MWTDDEKNKIMEALDYWPGELKNGYVLGVFRALRGCPAVPVLDAVFDLQIRPTTNSRGDPVRNRPQAIDILARYKDLEPKMYPAKADEPDVERISFEKYKKRVDEKTHSTTDADRYEIGVLRRAIARGQRIGDGPKAIKMPRKRRRA